MKIILILVAALALALFAAQLVAFGSEAPSMMLTVIDKNQLAAFLQQRQRTMQALDSGSG